MSEAPPHDIWILGGDSSSNEQIEQTDDERNVTCITPNDDKPHDNSVHLNRPIRRKKSSQHVLNISKDPSVVKLPRVPKDDIRRKYPIMLMNTLNGMDLPKLYHFISLFTHPQTLLKRQTMSPRDPSLETESFSFYGREEIFRYMYVLGLLGPDRVFKLNHCSIITRSTTYRTEIVLDCTIEVNYLYGTDASKAGEFLRNFHIQQHAKLQSCMDPQEIQKLDKTFQQSFPQLTQPLPRSFRRKIILVIDNVYATEELDQILIRLPV